MGTLWQDIRYGCRMLAKYPGMTATIVVTLALGIGANTAAFSAMEWLWLRPMPFAEPHRLARLSAPSERDLQGGFHYTDYRPIKEQMSSFSGLAAVEYRGATLAGQPWSKELLVAVISRNFFSVLGVEAYRGRVFTEDDDPDLKARHAIVISHRLWHSHFAGDPNLVGTTCLLYGRSYLILGIAPPGFDGIEREATVDMWYPMETPSSQWRDRAPDARTFTLVGRLAPHVSVGQAQKEAEVVFARLGLKDRGTQAELKPTVMLDQDYHRKTSGSLASLRQMAITLVVLAIACANVCGLLLAQAQTRGKEMALRRTLGSTRIRLVRQLFTQGCLLSLLGQSLGLLIAVWLMGLLRVSLPQAAADPQFGMRLNVPVVGFSIGLSLLATMFFGLLPAWRTSKTDLVPILKADSAHTRQGGHALGGLNALVVGQLALALVLVAITGLLLRSYLNRSGEDLGFEKRNILITKLIPVDDEQVFYRTLMPRIKAMPGVKNATLTLSVPFVERHSRLAHQVSLPGREGAYPIIYNLVTPEHFRILGIPLLRGRGFEEQDDSSRGKVVIVNETLARRFWPGEDPVGKFIRLERDEAQVIGVVRNGRYQSIADPAESYLYIPLAQQFFGNLFLLVETEGNPRALEAPVCEVIRGVGRGMDLYPMKTLAECVDSALFEPRRQAELAGASGLVGMILAGAGLYGVIALAVSRRTQEFGIRMALGAHRRDIVRLTMRRGLRLGLCGIGLGSMGTVMAGRVVRASLYEIGSADPMTLILSALVLSAVSLLACYLPARRAARIDPMAALRCE